MSPGENTQSPPQERRFEQQEWFPATCNRFRALLSLTYRLAVRNGKVTNNPAQLVKHRPEDNVRVRFLSPEDDVKLRKAIQRNNPDGVPEFELAMNTGMRLSEQYGLTWANVSLERHVLTIPRSKNGASRHVPLNQSAIRALEELRKRTGGTGFVCGGAPGPRRWFEPAVTDSKLTDFTWHCLGHTFASRLVMAGVDLHTVQELMGHKTIGMTVRHAHLAPKHLVALERLDSPAAKPSDTRTDTEHDCQASEHQATLQ